MDGGIFSIPPNNKEVTDMKLIITPEEARAKGVWDKLCDIKGMNVWAIIEGLIDSNAEIVLTEDEARNLGLLPSETK